MGFCKCFESDTNGGTARRKGSPILEIWYGLRITVPSSVQMVWYNWLTTKQVVTDTSRNGAFLRAQLQSLLLAHWSYSMTIARLTVALQAIVLRSLGPCLVFISATLATVFMGHCIGTIQTMFQGHPWLYSNVASVHFQPYQQRWWGIHEWGLSFIPLWVGQQKPMGCRRGIIQPGMVLNGNLFIILKLF
jgi:hypothetical protein